MYPMLEHPDVTCALRTGYPSWVKDRDLDVDDSENEYENIDGYDNEDSIYEERRETEYGWQ